MVSQSPEAQVLQSEKKPSESTASQLGSGPARPVAPASAGTLPIVVPASSGPSAGAVAASLSNGCVFGEMVGEPASASALSSIAPDTRPSSLPVPAPSPRQAPMATPAKINVAAGRGAAHTGRGNRQRLAITTSSLHLRAETERFEPCLEHQSTRSLPNPYRTRHCAAADYHFCVRGECGVTGVEVMTFETDALWPGMIDWFTCGRSSPGPNG